MADWFDFAPASERIEVSEMAMSGTGPNPQDMAPDATQREIEARRAKLRCDKLWSKPCPMGYYPLGYVHRTVASRLPIWC